MITMAAGSGQPPRKPSGSISGWASDTAAAAEARNPARVMPIWTVDRNWLGSRASLATSRPRPSSASRRRSCPSRSEINATSLPAKAALTTSSTSTNPTWTQRPFTARPAFARPRRLCLCAFRFSFDLCCGDGILSAWSALACEGHCRPDRDPRSHQ